MKPMVLWYRNSLYYLWLYKTFRFISTQELGANPSTMPDGCGLSLIKHNL